MFTFADEDHRTLVVRCLLFHLPGPSRYWNVEQNEPSSRAVEAAAGRGAEPEGDQDDGDVQWLRFALSLWDGTPRAVHLGRLEPPRLRCLGTLLRAVAAGDKAVDLWVLSELGEPQVELKQLETETA